MNKRPGQIKVTMETGYCSFCDRPRNLRREERHLGTFVRTIVACETCHRILSSTMGVAGVEASVEEKSVEKPDAVVQSTPAPAPAPKATPKPAKRAATPKSNTTTGASRAPKSRASKPR